MYFRNKSKYINNLLGSPSREVLVVEGARQVGKTTLLENVLKDFPKSVMINLETDLNALHAIDATASFEDLELYLSYSHSIKDEEGVVLCIDEAQESQVLGRYVRSFKEKWKHAKVVLTGSSMSRLFRKEQRIPVGRYTSIFITPMSFREFLQAREKDSLINLIESFKIDPDPRIISSTAHELFLKELDQYITVGGLPEVVRQYLSGGNWKKTRYDIFLSQSEDFIRNTEIEDRFLFTSAMKSISNNLGSPSKYTSIDESYPRAKKICSILKSWKLIYEIEQRGNAPNSTFYPKRYIYDIGIAHDLRDLSLPNISILHTLSSAQRTPLGGLLENALLLQVISDEDRLSISGWKNSSNDNKEIDFVLKSEQYYPIECKSSLKYSSKQIYGLREYLKISGLSSAALISLSPYQKIQEEKCTFYNVPFYLFDKNLLEKLFMKQDF
jgi:uncharacterized protein